MFDILVMAALTADAPGPAARGIRQRSPPLRCMTRGAAARKNAGGIPGAAAHSGSDVGRRPAGTARRGLPLATAMIMRSERDEHKYLEEAFSILRCRPSGEVSFRRFVILNARAGRTAKILQAGEGPTLPLRVYR